MCIQQLNRCASLLPAKVTVFPLPAVYESARFLRSLEDSYTSGLRSSVADGASLGVEPRVYAFLKVPQMLLMISPFRRH